jgi:hypothetical protein
MTDRKNDEAERKKPAGGPSAAKSYFVPTTDQLLARARRSSERSEKLVDNFLGSAGRDQGTGQQRDTRSKAYDQALKNKIRKG